MAQFYGTNIGLGADNRPPVTQVVLPNPPFDPQGHTLDSVHPETWDHNHAGLQMAGAMGPPQLKDDIIQGLLGRNTQLREANLKQNESFLMKEREILDVTKELHQEKGNALEIHKKLLRRDTENSTTVNGLKEAYRGAKAAKLEVDGQLLEEQEKNRQKDDEINDLRTKNVKFELTAIADQKAIADLENKLQQAQAEPVAPPEPVAPLEPRGPHFLHPEAPRGCALPEDFRPSRGDPTQQSKLRPSTYGSNSHWDLGLCYVNTFTKGKCQVQRCEWRHTPLTHEERAYIRGLEPKGPSFLERYDELARGVIRRLAFRS